jgi:hypothetical protein
MQKDNDSEYEYEDDKKKEDLRLDDSIAGVIDHRQSQRFPDKLRDFISIRSKDISSEQKVDIGLCTVGQCKEHFLSENIMDRSVLTSKHLLHQACYLYPTNLLVIRSALILEVSSLQTRIPTPVKRSHPLFGGKNPLKRFKKETLLPSLPLHIAIHNQGSLEVLKYLTIASPDVVAMKDGPEDCTAISAVLYQGRFDCTLLTMLVQWNQEALSVVDHFQNTSLHVACAQGAPFDIVHMIYYAYPKALCQRNGMGQTPIHIAQINGLCTLKVIDFLQELLEHQLERNACHLDHSDDQQSL